MQTIKSDLGNGNEKTYQIVNGTAYSVGMKLKDGAYQKEETPGEVIRILEDARTSGRILRIHYGDRLTGRDWLEENDVQGRISRSTGRIKIPILVAPGEDGGPGLLDNCIVKITTASKPRRTLWQHPSYHTPELELTEITSQEQAPLSDGLHHLLWAKGYRYIVKADGTEHARFKKRSKAEKFIALFA